MKKWNPNVAAGVACCNPSVNETTTQLANQGTVDDTAPNVDLGNHEEQLALTWFGPF